MKLILKDNILLKNDVFIIRKFKEADTENMYQLFSSERVMEFIEPVFDYKKTVEFIKKYALIECPSVFAVFKNNKSEEFLGYVIFKPYDEISYEIGWLLNENHWGKGYANHITNELIRYSKDNNIKKLIIEFDKNQKVSEKIAIKNGFSFAFYDENLIVYEKNL